MTTALQTAERPALVDAYSAPAVSRTARLVLPGLVLGLALGLRLWGLSWGLPSVLHPDEGIYVERARAMAESGDLNPKYFQNPSLFTYLIAGGLLLTHALGPLAGPLAPDVPGAAYLLARLLSALLGTAGVALLYAIGATLFGRRVGLLAALFLAVSFLHARDSHYGVNDVAATTLLLLSVYFAARLLRQPSLCWYVLAGLAGGLATSTKYNASFFFAPLLAAHCLARSSASPLARSRALALASAAALCGFFIGTPYALLDFGQFQRSFLEQYRFGSNRWLGQSPDPVPMLYLSSLLQGFGALPLALAMAGLVLAWRRHRRETVLLITFPLTYLAFMLKTELFFVRFALPLVPYCSLLAAHGAAGLVARVRPVASLALGRFRVETLVPTRGDEGVPASCRRRLWILATLLSAVLAQPLAYVLLHHRLLPQTSTRVLATDWVQANVPPGSSVKVVEHSLTLPPGLGSRTPAIPGLRIEFFDPRPEADEDSARKLADRDVQYVVTSSFDYDRYFMDPPLRWQQTFGRRYQRLQDSLEQQAQLVARFSPGIGERDVPFSVDNRYTPFWNLEQHERHGPTIRIYSLAPLATRGR
jgi:hypothetical protein